MLSVIKQLNCDYVLVSEISLSFHDALHFNLFISRTDLVEVLNIIYKEMSIKFDNKIMPFKYIADENDDCIFSYSYLDTNDKFIKKLNYSCKNLLYFGRGYSSVNKYESFFREFDGKQKIGNYFLYKAFNNIFKERV